MMMNLDHNSVWEYVFQIKTDNYTFRKQDQTFDVNYAMALLKYQRFFIYTNCWALLTKKFLRMGLM